MPTTREARLAAMKARRAAWPDDPDHQARAAARQAQLAAMADPTVPKCQAPRCGKPELRAGRCAAHWQPMRAMVGAMAGEDAGGVRPSRRWFSQAMATTSMPLARWQDGELYAEAGAWAELHALLDEATEALFAAGWRLVAGPRGGTYLRRTANL